MNEPWLTVKELAQPVGAGGIGAGRTFVQAMRTAMELDGVLWRQELCGGRRLWTQQRSVCLAWREEHPEWRPEQIYPERAWLIELEEAEGVEG